MPHLKIRNFLIAASCSLAVLLSGAAQASEDAPVPAEDAPLVIETVTVTGRSPAKAQKFIEDVVISKRSDEQLARWDDRVCMTLSGLKPEQAQYVIDQVSARAAQVGLRPGEPGCEPDVLIFVTDDPNGLAQGLFEKRKSFFAYYSTTFIKTAGRSALDDFLTSSQPVRWWHIAQEVTADGRSHGAGTGGVDAVSTIGTGAPVSKSKGSRIQSNTRQNLYRAIVIVDVKQMQGIPLAALADYLTMVSLVQVDPELDTLAQPSILNLFDENASEQPRTMTDWDFDFLQGLYSSQRDLTSFQQVRDIARQMERQPKR
ncbi:MAG: hypothetical protein R3C13_04355 [Hyphomonas sp.]|uniref:hypothetical protein n=1 Tax=Hyphomonas sp. TaxID=87 RepID=UPI0035298944